MRLKKIILLLLLVLLSASWAFNEMQTSFVQSRLFSHICRGIDFWKEPGPSHSIRFPNTGPYDLRMGYSQIPYWADLLSNKGYQVESQARASETFLKLVDLGLFPIYHEKVQAGLRILDSEGQEIFATRYPQRIYPAFEAVPPVIVKTLLFIENRHLLDKSQSAMNPAVEWERLGKAFFDLAIDAIDSSHSVGGGSTLATQLEKYQHSPEGITGHMSEKLRQMVSASLRSYLEGENTYPMRKRIFLKYVNSIPLAAIPKFGEVNGLGDGLWAWFDTDMDEVNRLLFALEDSNSEVNLQEAGAAYRKVLTLFLSHRQPSSLLIKERNKLQALTDRYLKILAEAGIISAELRDAALQHPPIFRQDMDFNYPIPFEQWKTANLLRTRLLEDLKGNRFYNLDRYDLTVYSTLKLELQNEVMGFLQRMKDRDAAYGAGFNAPNLLARGNPAGITYSISLYESTDHGNLLRVRTNSTSTPFDMDESAKVDMGSTAKLRTIVHYLEIIEALYEKYGEMKRAELIARSEGNLDPLTRWAIGYFLATPERNLTTMLDAALERVYSANPEEKFFTGGGLHSFGNFSKTDNFKFHTLKTAIYNSVNLVFIRLMRDMVYYHIFERIGSTPSHLEKLDDDDIKTYLSKFADQEGSVFLARFYRKYSKASPREAAALLLKTIRHRPAGYAAVFRYLKPETDMQAFSAFMAEHFPESTLTPSTLSRFYSTFALDAMNLGDRGYIAHIHPLELWVVGYKHRFPNATYSEMMKASAQERQDVYRWLFRTRYKAAKLKRIRVILELEAFQDIHQAWKKVGYPFNFLIPSYASSIGSSGDKPSALAELMGIILNNGLRKPSIRFQKMHFAEDTPFETILDAKGAAEVRVLSTEVAEAAKQLLIGVTREGTARVLNNALAAQDGSMVVVGGKTGTGDHRFKTFGAGGQITGQRTVSRSAAFVFFLGDRHYGILTAFVSGEEAAKYSFTSGLPTHILKNMWPILRSSLDIKGAEPLLEAAAQQ